MVSNTFTAVAESAGITGIETHRHLGEKRYEIKDHLGNVRAVVSDIKNADDYSLSASSWKFLADVRSLSNYYPYGMQIETGSWSGGDYNYGYNGKQEEPFYKNFLHYGARTHNTELSNFIKTDAFESQFPNQSPYVYGGSNPILNKDINGDWAWVANSWYMIYRDELNYGSDMSNFKKSLFDNNSRALDILQFDIIQEDNLQYNLNKTYKLMSDSKNNAYAPKIAKFLKETDINVLVTDNSKANSTKLRNADGFVPSLNGKNMGIVNHTLNKETLTKTFIHELVHLMGYDEFQAFSTVYSMGLQSKESFKGYFTETQLDYLLQGSGIKKTEFFKLEYWDDQWNQGKSYDDRRYKFISSGKEDEFYDIMQKTGEKIRGVSESEKDK